MSKISGTEILSRRHVAAPGFSLACRECGGIHTMPAWLRAGQRCPECNGQDMRVQVPGYQESLRRELRKPSADQGLWRYFDILPLQERGNVVSFGGEGAPLERWSFLERAARAVGIHCRVHAHRFDLCPGTNSFKDLAASLAVSAFREHDVPEIAISSTGNISVAYARYAARAGIRLHAFLPEGTEPINLAAIRMYGQAATPVAGDYGAAKRAADEYARSNGSCLLTAHSLDPLRIQAKKTIPFEWKRLLPEFPTVYIQALSGGTGPLAVDQGCRDLRESSEIRTLPRQILIQADGCRPMAASWQAARDANFPQGWEQRYETVAAPRSTVMTLATGTPVLYPLLAPRIREGGGEILSFPESSVPLIARLAGMEEQVLLGPAACVALGGFFRALHLGKLHNGDVVVLMIGEGAARSPQFLNCAAPENQPGPEQLRTALHEAVAGMSVL